MRRGGQPWQCSPVEVHERIDGFRASLDERRAAGVAVGFVPTMGYLHDGHGSLIGRAAADCGAVAVSIFVNPLQFAANVEELHDLVSSIKSAVRQVEREVS